MNDMSSVIVPKSDQINADDLIVGPMTIAIREVQIRGGQEQPVSIYFDGSDKAFRPCKSMSRVLVQAWGPDAKVYVGRSLTLYRDPTVKWAGMEVGGIRISHMSHIDGKMQMQLTATKGQRKPHIVMPLVDAPKQSSNGDQERAWADKFITNVNRAPDAEKLSAFVAGKQTLLDELGGKRPDLHAECQSAIEVKRASFTSAGDFEDDDDDPFGEGIDEPERDVFGLEPLPSQAEPTEAQPSDAEESPTAKALLEVRGGIAAAQNVKYLKAVEDKWLLARAAYDDDTAGEIDGLIAAKRRELSGEGA